MTWFKVDDGWHKHRKRIRAGLDLEGLAAHGLWCAAGSWASDELTDGWVPDGVLTYLSPGISKKIREKLVEKLVAAELWVRTERNGETGINFHDWEGSNPLRAQVLLEREAAARRQRDARDRARQKGATSRGESRRDTSVTNGVTNGVSHGSSNGVSHSPPSRPDPSRPEPLSSKSKSGGVDLSGSLPKQDHPEDSKTAAEPTAAERQRRKRYCDEHYSPDDRDCTGCHNAYGDCGYWSKLPAGEYGRRSAARFAAGEV